MKRADAETLSAIEEHFTAELKRLNADAIKAHDAGDLIGFIELKAQMRDLRKDHLRSLNACPLCKGECAGHINMRDAELNDPGQGRTPGFGNAAAPPRAPWGYQTARQSERGYHRKKQNDAILAKRRAAEAARALGRA